MGSTPALCNGQYKTILSKFFKLSSVGNISDWKAETFLVVGGIFIWGLSRKIPVGFNQVWHGTGQRRVCHQILFWIAVSVGQIWEDDRCKKIIVFSFDLDSFWLLLSLVTGWFFKGGEARIFEMVSYCEMLSWMISGFSSWAAQIIVPVTTNSFPFRQSLIFHIPIKRWSVLCNNSCHCCCCGSYAETAQSH